jgi:cytoskeleton protein RodZ
MVEQRKRKPSAAKAAQSQGVTQAPLTVGQMLAQKRMEKGLSLEDVSREINVRAAQIRAIEEARVADLPGMTYALGFVRSYAQYLKLDVTDVVNRFKLEHAVASAPKPDSKPIETAEDEKIPDHRLMIGAGALFVAVLSWVLWPSSGPAVDADTVAPVEEIVSAIPDPPAIETAEAPVVEPAPAVQTAPPPVVDTVAVPLRPTETADIPRLLPAARPDASEPAAVEAPAAAPAVTETAALPPPEEIIVAPPKGKVVIRAVASSWVEIMDANEKTVFKKVLKPGDQYFVPNQPGMTLRTSNAGGLEIYVAGKLAPAIGRSGDIVRGVELSPDGLMRPRRSSRIRNY